MSYTIEKYPEEPIIVNTLHANFNFEADAENSTREAMKLLDTVPEPVYYIADTSQVNFDMDDTVKGSSFAARGDNPIFHHPNIKQVLLVIGDNAVQAMTAEGMRTEIYGNVNIKTFATQAEALAYAREQ
jgi:hypothetical protein